VRDVVAWQAARLLEREGRMLARLDSLRGLERWRGVLRPDADPDRLATGLMAALQGGYLLARTAHDTEPMAVALNISLDHVRSFATTH